MSTEVQKIEYNQEQINLIKSQIAPKATNDELKMFLYHAQKTGLDPLARQIYAIHRKTKDGDQWRERMTIQTSIDGFRVIAERSGVYAGQDEPEFIEDNGMVVKATVRVYKWRNDVRYLASVGVAYWNEYAQTDREGKHSGLWGKMPHTMLSKVAEALALRKAFPQDLSNLYTGDEMEQANDIVKPEPTKIIADAEEDYTFVLSICRTVDDLKTEWLKIPKDQRPKYQTLKDAMKTQIENAAKEQEA